jgi:hypothetical protein
MKMLHSSTFEYLKPTDMQMDQMARVRMLFASFVKSLDVELPEGPDKTFVLRQLRDCAMWANVSLTRNADGTPRT